MSASRASIDDSFRVGPDPDDTDRLIVLRDPIGQDGEASIAFSGQIRKARAP